MPNIGGKGFPSVPTRYESSKKRYMNSTAESRNKQINRNEDEEDQERKRSPLRSPRLCEEDYPPNNLHLKIEIKREYCAQKYDDPAQAQPIENETYFQTLPQDEFGDSYEHKPRPPSGSSSSKKLGKERRVTPKSSDKNKEYSEKAEFGKEHKLCNMKLSVKEREINRLKGIIDNISKPLEAKRFTYERGQSKRFDDLQRQVNILEDKLFKAKSYLEKEQEKTERLTHQHLEKEDKLTDMRLKCMRFDDLQRQVNVFADQLFKAKSNLEKEQEKTERLTHQNQEKEDKLTDMRSKYMRLKKVINEFKQMHEISAEGEKKIVEQQTELEKMCTKMEKFKKVNDSLSENNNKLEDRIRKLQAKLDHLERFGETHKPCVEIQDGQSRYIKELECEVESQDNNFLLLQNEYDNLNCSYSTMKAEMAKVKHHLQTELDAKTEEVNKLTRQQIRLEEFRTKYYIVKSDNKKVWENCSDLKRQLEDKVNELENVNSKLNRAESLSLEVKILQREKANVEEQNSELTRVLQAKGIEMESLIKHRERSEKQIRNLNNEISDIQKSKRHTVNESLQQLLTENSSLKSTLEHRTLEIENLSKECEKQRRTREKGEHEMTELEQMVQKKKNEVDELNTRIEDLLNKGTNQQKYKTDAEHKTSTLMNVLKEKETEIEALREQLARAEKNVSILSQDIKDIQASKRQVAEEKLKDLQTENASLKSALSKATNEIEDLLNKGTNLQKYKTDAEHKTSTLKNAMKEKESEIEALREQLARAEKNVSILSQDIKDIQASKRHVAEEKLKDLQIENASLKSALSNATNEIEDLLNKGTDLQKYKTDAEHKTSTLINVLKEKETKIEALSNQLARSEENVSILSKDIKNIKESKRQVAEEKLQDLQTENASLKLTLAEATTKIDDLWIKCTNLQKYKKDTEHEIRTLLNALEEKDTEIENLRKHLARSEKNISILSKDIEDIQGSKRQAADEKVQSLKTENASLKLELAKATTEIDAFRNQCTNLQKYKTDTEHTMNTLLNAVKEKETEFETFNKQQARKNNELSKDVSNLKKEKENVENHRNSLSKALAEKEKEIEIMRNDIARYTEKISTLTKYVEDIQGSKTQAAEESIKGLQKKNDSLESDLRSATSEIYELSRKYKHLQKDNENAKRNINNLSKTVQERDKEIDSLVEELAKAGENVNKAEKIASADVIQKLKEDNASLQSDLVKQKQETEKKVSDLTKELKNLQKSKGTGLEEYNARKLYDENEFLKAQLDRTSRNYEQLRKDYNEVKREKDHALNRLSSVAGEKLRNNNPGIADLSDENRPINLGEKFSQLYDDQWTDAIEHLEEMGYSETDGIRCLLDILKAVFDECVKLSDIHFNQLKELTGTSHLPSDQLKKLKDLRKATAIHSVAKTKHHVNDYMSKAFSKEKAACQTYIDRSIELCWLMSVQDPPVVIDFIAVHGQAIDDKILRKFTKTGSKIDFLVWPVIRLHKNGPLLQKGVVQPI